MSKSLLALFASIVVVAGCQAGQGGSDYNPEASFRTTPQTYNMAQIVPAGGAPYSYQFSDLDCTTGKHEFATEEEFCGALTDNRLNEYCAESARREYFMAQCWKIQSN